MHILRTMSVVAVAVWLLAPAGTFAAELHAENGPAQVDGPTATSINPYPLLGKTPAQLAAQFPALSPHQLVLLVFRIADINSQRPAALTANVINPYELLLLTRDQVAQRYPALPQRELDRLMFKIADINSIRTLAAR